MTFCLSLQLRAGKEGGWYNCVDKEIFLPTSSASVRYDKCWYWLFWHQISQWIPIALPAQYQNLLVFLPQTGGRESGWARVIHTGTVGLASATVGALLSYPFSSSKLKVGTDRLPVWHCAEEQHNSTQGISQIFPKCTLQCPSTLKRIPCRYFFPVSWEEEATCHTCEYKGHHGPSKFGNHKNKSSILCTLTWKVPWNIEGLTSE